MEYSPVRKTESRCSNIRPPGVHALSCMHPESPELHLSNSPQGTATGCGPQVFSEQASAMRKAAKLASHNVHRNSYTGSECTGR